MLGIEPAAAQVVMFQALVEQLPEMVRAAAVPIAEIDKIVMIDQGGASNGSSPFARFANSAPSTLYAFLEQFKAITGMDLGELVQGRMSAMAGPVVTVDGTTMNKSDTAGHGDPVQDGPR